MFQRCCLFALLLFYSFQVNSDQTVTSEYKLKAALLYKLTKFIKWPDKNTDTTEQTFELCLLGKDYFGTTLKTLEGRKVVDKAIVVRHMKQSREIKKQCDLVFISETKKAFLRPILKAFEGRPILTVGDIEGFAEKGGIVQFTSGKRIGFKINNEQSKKSGLQIAAPLLQLSTIVDTRDN